MDILLGGTKFTLLKEKALWNIKDEMLLIADIHLGKAMHFRKSGIPININAQTADYTNLIKLFEKMSPKTVYFLGDIFHSHLNKDWINFESFIHSYPNIKFVLIKGNHDIIMDRFFKELKIEVINEFIEDNDFIYSHKPVPFNHTKINITGHIHPGILIKGFAKQSLKVPVFCQINNTFILPAFGRLTGLHLISNSGSNMHLYLILDDEVRPL